MTKTYKFDFVGRTVGALGIFYRNVVEITANDFNEAMHKLYDKYEHIQRLSVFEDGIELIPVPEWK